MTLAIPSIEVVLVGWINDLIDTEPARTQHPADLETADAWVLVQDIGFQQITKPAWQYESVVQLDSYGGPDPRESDSEAEANHLTILGALDDLKTATVDGLVVHDVTAGSLGRQPDPAFPIARARYIAQATIRWRPA